MSGLDLSAYKLEPMTHLATRDYVSVTCNQCDLSSEVQTVADAITWIVEHERPRFGGGATSECELTLMAQREPRPGIDYDDGTRPHTYEGQLHPDKKPSGTELCALCGRQRVVHHHGPHPGHPFMEV